jgi:hypothetical protein
MRAAAALLAVPGRYQQSVANADFDIARDRLPLQYDVANLGPPESLNVQVITRFLALAGVSVDEAEGWRSWAAAFVATELAERPNGPGAAMLQEAQTMMQARINNDRSLVLQRVPANAPGYYNPHSTRATQQATAAQTASTPTVEVTPPAAEEEHVALSYDDNEQDEDTRMGPA